MAAKNSLQILQRFEELVDNKLELCMQLQSLVDTSAQSLHAFRTHCSTSRELIKDEIRMLEGKLIQRIGRQLAVRRLLSQHFIRLSQELNLSQYLETDLDVFVAQREASISGDSQVSSMESLSTETGESALTCVLDKIRLVLDEELAHLPSMKQWLEIVGLQPACVKAIMELVGNVEDLLQTSESKLKAVIVSSSGVCTCRPADIPGISSDDAQMPESTSEDTSSHKKDSTLRVENGMVKEKGKLPFYIREDVRRLITACRLLRIYTDRLLTDDNDLRELASLNPTELPPGPSQAPSAQIPIPSSSSSSATPPNSLVRKESVKSLYWDSWRYRPSTSAPPVPDYPAGSGLDVLSPSPQVPFCSIHISIEKRYGMMEPRPSGQRLPSMLSSFSSDDNFLSSPSASQSQYPVPPNTQTKPTHRLTSQSSVMSSVSTATTTGDEADLVSIFADLQSASSSCANSVFPSANNILQLVQQYDTSPATMKRQFAAAGVDERDAHSQQSVFPSPGSDSNVIIRPSSSTPSLLLTGLSPPVTAPGAIVTNMSLTTNVHRKELVKFTKSSSLESSLRHRLNSDDAHTVPLTGSAGNSGSSNSSSTTNITSAAKMNHPSEKVHSRRMHHSIHHVFKSQFFLTQTVCGFCEKSLRGLGRKCRHCKLRFHPDCAEKMPPSCGLPDGLVRAYYHSINPGSRDYRVGSGSIDAATVQEDVRVEDDDDTLSEFTKRKPSDVEMMPSHKKYATISKGSEIGREGKTWRSNLKWFANSKTPPPLDSPGVRKARVKKQRSMSTGNAREAIKSPATPVRSPPQSPELRSPIIRRISGSFSLPKDRRKRNNLVLPKDEPKVSKSFHSLSTEQAGVDGEKLRTRLPSGASMLEKGGVREARTVSVSSTGGGTSPGNNSQDSLSAPSSSAASSNSASPSVPASPGSISYGRSASGSTGPPVSPLALTSFVHPRNYRSFMKTVKDQIKSHFPWPTTASKEAGSTVPKSPTDTTDGHHEVKKTPLFSRRKSDDKGAQWYDNSKPNPRMMTPEEEEESVRLEAEDSFPSEPSNTFPTVLVQPNALLDAVKAGKGVKDDGKKGLRRFSLLEGQEEAEQGGGTVLKVPTVEVEDDNEPSYSSEISGDHTESSPIPWRRQQSLYLRELNIPYEQLTFGEKLGPGTFGQVYRGKWHGDVAIKILNDDYLFNDAEEVHEAFKQDLATLRKTRHDNLVLFMGACMKRSHVGHQQIIITSLLSRGLSSSSTAGTSVTLHDLIHEARGKSLTAPYKVQLNRLLIIASQVCQGMGYLHRRGIVHKDLKTKNIFVTHEKCIITDYGLFSISKMSQHGRSDDFLWFPKNWICYLAPEICRRLRTPRHQKQTFTAYRASNNHNVEPLVPFSIFSDVYAFGTVLYELCTGTFPLLYSANNAQRLVHSLSTSSVHSGMATPLSDTPSTPVTSLPPSTPSSLNFPGVTRSPRPPDPNLPGSLESALFLIASGAHPIFRLFRSRTTQGPRSGSTSTPGGVPKGAKHPGSPPQSLTITPGTPPTPVHAPVYLLSPSIDETAARELIEMISLCWSPKLTQRKEFPDLFQMLERVPKKSLARSPSHPVHGNNPAKDTIHY